MQYKPDKHHRRSIRLKGYDYSQPGGYFITICTQRNERKYLLGDIVDGKMLLNNTGRIVENVWHELSNHYTNVRLDAFVIMPNHIHGVIILVDRGLINQNGKGFGRGLINQNGKGFGRGLINQTPTWNLMQNPKQHLGKIIRYFKAKSTKLIHDVTSHDFKWQRNYYEHIIRNENELSRIRKYIINNPLKWEYDRNNPYGKPDDTEKQFWKNFK